MNTIPPRKIIHFAVRIVQPFLDCNWTSLLKCLPRRKLKPKGKPKNKSINSLLNKLTTHKTPHSDNTKGLHLSSKLPHPFHRKYNVNFHIEAIWKSKPFYILAELQSYATENYFITLILFGESASMSMS